jgi:twinkle protein
MTNRPCSKCREVGRDKTGDHLFLMSDGVTWGCFKSFHKPYFERDGEEYSEGSMPLQLEDVKHLPCYGSVDRRISKKTHEYFKVRTELSQDTASPVAVFYPETSNGKFIGYKQRTLPKRFITLHKPEAKGLVPDFFGQPVCPKNGKRILICAGEEDTMAAYEMLLEKYPEITPCIVGLPRGESGTATVTENLEFLKGFDEVIIGTDMDDAGRKALSSIAPIVGDRARVLVLSEKDISDMRIKGKEKEFINAYFNAREYRPVNIVSVSDILDRAIAPRPWGLSYPFQKLTQMSYGLKKEGETISIGGGPGCGKTTLVYQIQQHLMFQHHERLAIFNLEEKAEGALNHLIGTMINKPIHKPDCQYDLEEARRAGELLEGKAEFYDGFSEDWNEVESQVRYFASKGIKFFFIDPISALVEHLSPSDANTELGRIYRAIRKFRMEQRLTFFIVNHLNNPQSGKDHGAGGEVYGSQFSGSRAQWKYSTALWGLVRDQLAENPDDRNKVKLVVIKDRLGGNTGYVHLKYNPLTGKLEEEFGEEF